ncbi:hypothetical protein [Candidatus Oleimmundimicrobium sp.]|uniref:RsiG family protein n=1 Tax=Candidatus Oleimmundimicrobium sp. TaxID=3060597 RepID=UPI00271AC53A|nr:hypothetical protein [Candidatus Oleimmundimicrobium sp.]MDO8885322.1 hypothetical protein [Candidatus Oleimmundimicrobium sp.]
MTETKGFLSQDDILINLDKKSNEELKEILRKIGEEEEKLSCQRRILHGKIDIIRAELVDRLKKNKGDVSKKDIDRLSEILAKGVKGF